MKRLCNTGLVLFLICFICAKVNGQYLALPGRANTARLVFVSAGLEPEIVTSVGYVQAIGRQQGALHFKWGGEFKFAPVLISHGAWRADVVTVADWKMGQKWRNSAALTLYLAHDHNGEGQMNGVGFELRVNPVYYGRHWVKGLDAGWQYTAFTHIRNSEKVKNSFRDRYPDGSNGPGPKDGWYKTAASRFRIGFSIARDISLHSMLQASLGSLLNVQKQGIWLGFSHAQIPAYLQFSYNYNW